MLALLLALAPAWGQDLRAWQSMHDGMLIELIDGDIDQAIDWYEGLISALPEDDPSYPRLAYWKARALVVSGETEAALQTLEALPGMPVVSLQASVLSARLKATQKQIESLPVHHSFRTSTESWVHDWRNPGKGSIGLDSPSLGGDRTLAWNTRVEEGEEDAIGILMAETASRPRMIRMSIRSDLLSAFVLPTIEDLEGNRYTLDQPISLHRNDWVALDLRLSDFRPAEGRRIGKSPASIRSFQIRDVTAFYSSDRGPNTLFLGDVVIE